MPRAMLNLFKNRHGTYYYRQQIDGLSTSKSLFTKDYQRARLLASQLLLIRMSEDNPFREFGIKLPNGLEINDIKADEVPAVANLLKKIGYTHSQFLSLTLPEQANLLATGTLAPLPPQKEHTGPFNTVFELYLKEKEYDNGEKTLDEKRSKYLEFSARFKNPDFNSIGSNQAVKFKEDMIAQGLSAGRINKTISFMKDLFEWGRKNKKYFGENPWSDLVISKKAKLSEDVENYEPFTDGDLKKIFDRDNYKWLENAPDYYWLPLLGLFSGVRIEELAALILPKLFREPTPYFRVIKGKNLNSIRSIPICEFILEKTGFMAYVDSLPQGGQLFPNRMAGKNGFSKTSSQRFNDYLEKIGVKKKEEDRIKGVDRKLGFHSFRATFINRMTALNTHPALLMAFVGHYKQEKVDFSSAHFQTYQQQQPVEILKKVVDTLKFDFLDLSFFSSPPDFSDKLKPRKKNIPSRIPRIK